MTRHRCNSRDIGITPAKSFIPPTRKTRQVEYRTVFGYTLYLCAADIHVEVKGSTTDDMITGSGGVEEMPTTYDAECLYIRQLFHLRLCQSERV